MVSFLIDNNPPPSLVEWLSIQGIEAVHVREIELARASDQVVWDYALAHGLSIITKDKDFDCFALQTQNTKSFVFRFVIGNATNAQLFSWLNSRILVLQSIVLKRKEIMDADLPKVIVVK